jgi:hypothetical protein
MPDYLFLVASFAALTGLAILLLLYRIAQSLEDLLHALQLIAKGFPEPVPVPTFTPPKRKPGRPRKPRQQSLDLPGSSHAAEGASDADKRPV